MARKRDQRERDGGGAAGEIGATLAQVQERLARLEGQVFGQSAVGGDGAATERDGNAIFAVPLDGSVRVLAALASMPRLALYRAVLEHPATSGELMKAASLNTTGQLYHHLRELIGAGLIAQEGRDRYALVPERLPAARTILGAALGVAQAANLTTLHAGTPA
jgi:DNA-binding transcriptional ArsR family regulator